MFTLASNKEIGTYLSKLVDQEFKSQAEFCRAWLKEENMDANNEEIRKKCNKFTQIKKGRKGIQTMDLPIFCKLLNTTGEEILSAGQVVLPCSTRLTNYFVAGSNDKKVWNAYINHKDDLILKVDEYGNTVLDYAIRFKNDKFIAYLMKKNLIQFDVDDQDDDKYCVSFGVSTKIGEQDQAYESHDFPGKSKLFLRAKLIRLAMEKNNLTILKKLNVREILLLSKRYEQQYKAYELKDVTHVQDIKEYFSKDVMDTIAHASNSVVDYFTNTSTIRVDYKSYSSKEMMEYRNSIWKNEKIELDSKGKIVTIENSFMYFYISGLLDVLVENNHSFTEFALKKAIAYNKETYVLLKTYADEIKESIKKDLNYTNESTINAEVNLRLEINGFYIHEKTVRASYALVRNLVHVTAASTNEDLQGLIDELNTWYEKIIHVKEEYIQKTE